MQVVVVRKDEYIEDSCFTSLFAKRRYKASSDALSLLVAPDGNIIEKQFRGFRFGHWQRMRGRSADNLLPDECGHRPKLGSRK